MGPITKWKSYRLHRPWDLCCGTTRGTHNVVQSASSSGMSCRQRTTSQSSFSMAVAIFTRRRTMANQGSRCNRRRRTKENQRNQERKRDQEEVKEERITGKEDRRLEDAREGKDCIFLYPLAHFYLTRLSSSWTKNSLIIFTLPLHPHDSDYQEFKNPRLCDHSATK